MRARLRLAALLLLVAAAPCLAEPLPPELEAPAAKHVLVLLSYNHGHPWTDSVLGGLDETFEASGMKFEVFYEFMDMRRVDAPDHLDNLFRMLAAKYRATPLDLVIACDDEALAFLAAHRPGFHPDSPLVYSGLLPADRPLPGMVEVTQPADYKATLDLALRLRPTARRIVSVIDGTATSTMHRDAVARCARDYAGHVSFEYLDLSQRAMEEVLARLSALGDDSVVLLLGHNRDLNGRTFPAPDAMRLFRARCPVPMFGVSDSRLGLGIIGGKLTCGHSQGVTVAETALRILGGEKIPASGTRIRAENRFMFDHPVLERFGIEAGALPPGSVVIGKPPSPLERYRDYILGALLVIIALSALSLRMSIEIRHRRRVERSLLESGRLNREIIGSAHEGIVVIGKDRRLQVWNPFMEAFSGRCAAEAVGTFLGEAFPVLAGEDVAEAVLRALAGGTGGPLELSVETGGSGGRRFLSVATSPLKNTEGEIIGAIGTIRDITLQKRAEDHLRHAEKMSAIGQLAGGVAHDFNNQLCGIVGCADLLCLELENAEHRELVDGILTASRRAADLTRQLLAFSRKGNFLSAPVDLHAVIREVVALLEHSIDKRIRVGLQLEASPCKVTGDPTQLQNAILNLAINARDAMPAGGDLVFATRLAEVADRSLEMDLDPGRYLEFRLSDSGCGMDEATRSHLFEPFFTTKEPGKGTGLGLASVFGTVKSHRGAITVSSEVGRGTAFRILLPVLAEAAGVPAEPVPDAPAAKSDAAILVVDDETVIRDVANRMIRALGYRCQTFDSASKAIECYRAAPADTDLVILDMVMPEMSGREAFRALRAINPGVRAILTSGFSLNGEAQAALDEGVLGFIQKPYLLTEIARAISAALAKEA